MLSVVRTINPHAISSIKARDAAQPVNEKKELIVRDNILLSCSIVVYTETVNLRPHCSLKHSVNWYLSWNFTCYNIAVLVIWRIASVTFDDHIVKFNMNRIF